MNGSGQSRIRARLSNLGHNHLAILAVLLLASVVFRVGVAFYKGDSVPPPIKAPDETSYSYLAERLVTGYGFSFDRPWYPFAKPAGSPTAHWSFLYTTFLAGVYGLFGVHPLAGRLVGAVLGGLLLPLMVYRLARRLFPTNEQVALVSVGCTAVYAFFILFAANLMTETFYIIALLWTMERAMALAERPTPAQAVVLGFGLGLAALLRQSVLPWVMVLFAWLLWVGYRSGHFVRVMRALVLSGVLLVLMILPFTVRNYFSYNGFLLLNSNAGYAMYSAQHPMHGINFQEYAAAPLPEGMYDLNEAELDRELMRRGIGFVLAEPGRYLLLSLSRVLDYFEFWPTPDTPLLHNVGRVVSFALFLPFMLYGLWLAIRQQRPLNTLAAWADFSAKPLALVLLFMVFYSVLHIMTWAMARYRLPVDAVAMPFAALALTEWLFPTISRLFGSSSATV